ncbi:MAG: hypothetical protein ACOYM3_01065 [Terrimicrobiaceae bacterium]
MTDHQALNWIETHTVTLVVKPHVTKLLCGMYVFTSTHPDISMRIIECVTQAKEANYT